MHIHHFRTSRISATLGRAAVFAALASAAILAGCGETHTQRAGPIPTDPQDRISRNLNPALHYTIGEFATLVDSQPLPVEGYGIIAGLPGTGSGDMDPSIRDLLLTQLLRDGIGSYSNGTENISPEKILASNEIAVVEVRGVIPPLARKGSTFDLTVTSLANSGATSIANGLLWTSELKLIGLTTAGNDTHAIALGRGPVFIPAAVEAAAGVPAATQPGAIPRALRSGRVLGGGSSAEDRAIRLQLYSPNTGITVAIEHCINARFPARDKVATAEDSSIVSLHIPPDYLGDPWSFIEIVRHLYLSTQAPGFSERQATTLIAELRQADSPKNDLSLALQGLGRSILPDFIQPQYTDPDPAVRFWCAKAGAGMLDVGGMVVLQETIKDHASPFRRQAIQALAQACRGRDTQRATVSLYEMLRSPNSEDRIIAYQALLAIRSDAVRTYSVGRKFLMDIVPSDGPPLIYVTQADAARIAFIGQPVALPAGAVYVSPDNLLTVSVNEPAPAAAQVPPDASTGGARVLTAVSVSSGSELAAPAGAAENVTLYWRSPTGNKTVNIKSVATLPDLIARLTWIPDPLSPNYNPQQPYIGASYQRITEMLATMCSDQTLLAKFVIQKPPAPLLTPIDLVTGGRPETSTQPPPPSASAPTTAPATEPTP